MFEDWTKTWVQMNPSKVVQVIGGQQSGEMHTKSRRLYQHLLSICSFTVSSNLKVSIELGNKNPHFLFPSQKYKGVGPSAQMYDKPPFERKQEETSASLRLQRKCRLDKTRVGYALQLCLHAGTAVVFGRPSLRWFRYLWNCSTS